MSWQAKNHTKTLILKLKQAIYKSIFNLRWSMQKIQLKLKIYALRWQKFMKAAGLCEWCLMHTAHTFAILLLPSLLLADCGKTPAYAHTIDMDAIAQIESSNNPNAVGASEEIGLYQISPIVLKHYNQWVHPAGCDESCSSWVTKKDLFKDPIRQRSIASWYMGWLFDRCWTEFDTIQAWNRGIGTWRKWKESGSKWDDLPEITKRYIEKYARLTNKSIKELGYEKI